MNIVDRIFMIDCAYKTYEEQLSDGKHRCGIDW